MSEPDEPCEHCGRSEKLSATDCGGETSLVCAHCSAWFADAKQRIELPLHASLDINIDQGHPGLWLSVNQWDRREAGPKRLDIKDARRLAAVLLALADGAERLVPAFEAACADARAYWEAKNKTGGDRFRDANKPVCSNFSPPEYSGPWRDWHRGHGCDRDDGKPRSAAAAAEIAALCVHIGDSRVVP